MLEKNGIDFEYRDYRKSPLSEDELRSLLASLGAGPADVLRRRDRAFRTLGLTGTEPDGELISLMAANPTLLERPIGIAGDEAVVGRPPNRLLTLVKGWNT